MNLYLLFHLNTAFSSIEEEQLPELLQRCYWPLLQTLEATNTKAGIELTAHTLLTITSLDTNWTAKFHQLCASGLVECIGSGYSQMIAPLAPAEVNSWNQQLGRSIYQQHGFTPKIALINEMAYAGGIVEHYLDAGYAGVIMEWNNPRLSHKEWQDEWRYFPQLLCDMQGRQIPLIWADSIAFQKFQRFSRSEEELAEYLHFISSKKREEGYFPLYSSDAEIFDFRPGRFEGEGESAEGEWQRIGELFCALQGQSDCRFCLPSEVLAGLDHPDGGHLLSLESPQQPIPVKKQEKYNINRWALTGRGDCHINSACYSLYRKIKEMGTGDILRWQELCCSLWASDFRTHITEKRWQKYTALLQEYIPESVQERPQFPIPSLSAQEGKNEKRKEFLLKAEAGQIEVRVNPQKGLAVSSFAVKSFSGGHSLPLFGTLAHGFYDDITFGADFYSGHTVIETPAAHKRTDLAAVSFQQESGGRKISSIYRSRALYQEKELLVDKQSLTLRKKIILPKRAASRIHPFHFTFIPSSWDFTSLYFATHNGGSRLEYFSLAAGDEIRHDAMLSPLITAKQALGSTEGLVIIGDAEKSLHFRHRPEECAMIPKIVLRQAGDGQFFFRLHYAVQEIDETFVEEDSASSFSCAIAVSAGEGRL